MALSKIKASTLPAGSVLQVKNTVYDGQDTDSSGAFVSTGLTLSITPSSTSSKILVCPSVVGAATKGSPALFRLYRKIGTGSFSEVTGASSTQQSRALSNCMMGTGYNPSDTHHEHTQQNMSALYLDSPATTSQVTYTIYMSSRSSSKTASLNRADSWTSGDDAFDASVSTMTLMEIAG
jgi:hypothetical protein